MNILFLSNIGSGLKIFRGELIESFLSEGHHVYVSFPDDEYSIPLQQMGCTILDTPFNRRSINPVSDVKLLFSYMKMINEVQPDIVLTYTIKPNVYGGLACIIRKKPYFSNITGLGTSIQNFSIVQGISLLLYRVGLRKAECVFFQNVYNKSFMEQHHVKGKKSILLPGSGVNLLTHPYQPYPPKGGTISFLFAGRIMRDKGIEEFLQCAQVIHQRYPNTEFSIAGGYDESEYTTQVKELESNHVIRYLGWRTDIQNLMATHHAIIHPSYHEGLSNTLLDAAACGRPVITTNVPGCQETFDEGISGFGVPARDAKALIAAVEKFINLPYAVKEDMGRQGRKKVEREFDRKIVIDAYLKELQILKSRGTSLDEPI